MKPETKAKREADKKKKLEKNNTDLDPRYATKTDLDGIIKAVDKVAELVSGKIAADLKPKVIEKVVPEIEGTADLSRVKESVSQPIPPTEEERAGGIEKIPVPPAWRKIVDELLGMDFGIDVVYPQAGSGFLFKIIVPAEKSNMSKDYKEFYKVDIRTKSLNYNEGVDGVRKFCEGVKKNLETKKQ